MENNTALVVKQDGNVYAFKMPDKFAFESGGDPPYSMPYLNPEYYDAVEQAISSAVLCSDQEQAVSLIAHGQTILDIEKAKKYYCKPDHPYVIPGLTFTVKPRAGGLFHCPDCENCNCKLYPVALLSLTEIKEEKTEKQEPDFDFRGYLKDISELILSSEIRTIDSEAVALIPRKKLEALKLKHTKS
jgi:hypothetical protein